MAVDDDPLVLRLLTRILTQAGYEILEAGSVRDALKLLDAGRFSVLISDLNMPGGSGLDLARELRRKNADLPMILLSGSLEQETRREAERLGRIECMNKPLDQTLLLRVVRDLTAGEDSR